MSTSPRSQINTQDDSQTKQLALLLSGKDREDLSESERYWRDRKIWLEEKGYMLRPRYHPEWTPSWKNTEKNPTDCEDGQVDREYDNLMDARRISDGTIVMFKKISIRNTSESSRELEMVRLLLSEPYKSDPKNHCAPIYEILSLPNEDEAVLLVMPFLQTWKYNPELRTIGETVEFLRQIFEGLAFLHKHGIAHNDVKTDNIMMDSSPLYVKPMHPMSPRKTYDWSATPVAKTRTECPVKYYFIDFGLARQYNLPEGQRAQEHPGYGGDDTVPEFSSQPGEPCDPFAVDVYRLGNLVRKNLSGGGPWKVNPVFNFLHPLIADMTQDDPTKRPTMDEAFTRFESIVKKLGFLKLRSRVSYPSESFLDRAVRFAVHWPRQVKYVFKRLPAIPRPKA